MSISVINKKRNMKQTEKTAIVYTLLSLAAITVNYIYGIFGHGVHSVYMTWMFLYPLMGGVLFYIMIPFIIPAVTEFKGYRIFFNCYNSGVAALTMGSFLKGILDIAGTSSQYTLIFSDTGWVLITVGLCFLLISFVNKKMIGL